MYQVPVKDLEKVRRSRKRVKSILCDLALEDCQDLVKKFKPFDAGEHCFNNTEWIDFTDGSLGKKKKKWRYRTKALCCNLCWFSTRSFHAFKSHVQRCHEEERDLACLAGCPKCTFISHPKVTEQHMRIFHTVPPKAPAGPSATFTPSTSISPLQTFGHPANTVALTAAVTAAVSATDTIGDRYTCLNCGYHDSLLYVMKKHVLVNHSAPLLNRYFGHKAENAQKAFGSTKKAFLTAPKYFCKECKLPAETIEHLLYHILSSEKHIDLLWHIMPFIREKLIPNQKYAEQQKFLAPKVMQQPLMVTRPNFVQQTNAVKGNVPKSNGTMLLAGAANTTLLCPSARPVIISPQSSALAPGTSASTLQNTQQQSSTVVNSITNQVPVTMALPSLSSAQAAQQVLFPPGVQVNLPGKIGARPPMMVTPRLQLNQPSPRQSLMASQSVRLVPTGNRVNGVPTYTLAPVQAGSVQPNAGQVVKNTPVVLSQNGSLAGRPPESSLPDVFIVPTKASPSGQKQTMRKVSKPNELAVLAPFLKIQSNHTVKCLRCNVLLTEQWIFQHLLHGLKCLFCPLMFYSFKQIMEHTNKEHNLKVKKNRDFIKMEYQINCDDGGNLVFAAFNLNTDVPKDLLDNRELNLVLVTSTLEKIYIKMYPHSAKAMYPPTQRSAPTDCPFCKVKLRSAEEYEGHLKTMHHIVPTIHAILKSPAFKCIYCFGVYSEKSTPKTISIHVQRCRCAPKNVKEAERKLNPDPDPTVYVNGNVQNPIQLKGNLQVQRGEKDTGKLKKAGVSERNGRGRKAPSAPVVLELDPTGMEMKSFEDRKEFLTKYFHHKPYPSRNETQVLAKRLWMNKSDILFHFTTRRTRCMKAIQKKTTAVLLGFNMNEVNKVKHDLLIPEVMPIVKPDVNE